MRIVDSIYNNEYNKIYHSMLEAVLVNYPKFLRESRLNIKEKNMSVVSAPLKNDIAMQKDLFRLAASIYSESSDVVSDSEIQTQIIRCMFVAKENEYDKDLINMMRSSLWAEYRTYDELNAAIKVYLNSKPKNIATIGILKKGYIVKNRTFDEQMIMAYIYESFLEYYYVYHFMSQKLMVEKRSFEEQLLLTSAYLETNGNKKVMGIALNEAYLRNQDCKYQVHEILNRFHLDSQYDYLLEHPNELLTDKHISKVLRLDKYKR